MVTAEAIVTRWSGSQLEQHPEMPDAIALIVLQDTSAPYKGQWSLVQQDPETVAAIHATYHPEHALGCIIESRSFRAKQPAQAFTRHLITHGWSLVDLTESGEGFWSRLLEPC